MSDADYELEPLLFKLERKDSPAEEGEVEAFVVCAETEAKAWGMVRRWLKDNDFEQGEVDVWKKTTKQAKATLIGWAESDVPLGIVLVAL